MSNCEGIERFIFRVSARFDLCTYKSRRFDGLSLKLALHSSTHMSLSLPDMDAQLSGFIFAAGLVVAGTFIFQRGRVSRDGPPCLPSPPADFLIGHLRRVPRGSQHKAFADWGKTLGKKALDLPYLLSAKWLTWCIQAIFSASTSWELK